MKPTLYFGIIFLSIVLSVVSKTYAQSPDWLWLKSIGGESSEDFRSMAVDPESGDVFTMGVFTGTVDFDPGGGTFNLTSIGTSDIFINKLDGSGHFVWALAISGSDVANGVSISLDPVGSGDIYITGSFHGTLDFDMGSRSYNLTSTGTSDIFIAKFDGSGNFVWAKAIGGQDAVYVLSMALDPAGSGDVYTTGYFHGTVDFDPGAGNFNLTSKGEADIFISKLDGSGNFEWARGIGGIGSDVSRFIAIDPSGSGDVYTTGWFSRAADFDPSPKAFYLTSIGTFDTFVSKLDKSGNFLWAKDLGGSGVKNGSGSSIAIDPESGDIYTTGYFEGTADFDPGKGKFYLASLGLRDIFISKLDPSGNFVWARAMGGSGLDIGSSIMLDPSQSGGVYLLGNFQLSVDFDPGPDQFNLTSAGSYDIFITKVDSSGHFGWVKAIGVAKGAAAGSLALDADGYAYVAGFYFGSTISFGSTPLTNAGDHDIFVAKLDITSPLPIVKNKPQPIRIYPNPASNELNIEFEEDEIFNLGIIMFNSLGDVVFSSKESDPTLKTTIDISPLTAGIYFIEVNVDGKRVVKKIVKEYSSLLH